MYLTNVKMTMNTDRRGLPLPLSRARLALMMIKGQGLCQSKTDVG